MDDYAARLLAKLAPESVNRTLIRAGCFLSAYELIKAEVVDGVYEFFARDFRDGKFICDEARYQQDVLNRNLKSKYRASCAWLVEMGALTTAQAAVLEDIHAHRQLPMSCRSCWSIPTSRSRPTYSWRRWAASGPWVCSGGGSLSGPTRSGMIRT